MHSWAYEISLNIIFKKAAIKQIFPTPNIFNLSNLLLQDQVCPLLACLPREAFSVISNYYVLSMISINFCIMLHTFNLISKLFLKSRSLYLIC